MRPSSPPPPQMYLSTSVLLISLLLLTFVPWKWTSWAILGAFIWVPTNIIVSVPAPVPSCQLAVTEAHPSTHTPLHPHSRTLAPTYLLTCYTRTHTHTELFHLFCLLGQSSVLF